MLRGTRLGRLCDMSAKEALLQELAVRSGGLVSATQALALGFSYSEVDRRCVLGDWRRLCRGRYLVQPWEYSEDDIRRLLIRATADSLGPRVIAMYGTAAELLGLQGVPSSAPLQFSVSPASARDHRRGVRIHQATFGPGEIVKLGGTLTTAPARTVADLLRTLDRASAVSVADSALHQKLLAPDDLVHVQRLMARRTGAAIGRSRVSLLDARAESPLETRTRLICVDAGLAPEALQYQVLDGSGAVVARADLAWPSRFVIVEADGVTAHGGPDALLVDRRRQNTLVNLGWTVLRFTWADTRRPAYIQSVVRRALAGSTRRETSA